MYVSGEGSGKERREKKRKSLEEAGKVEDKKVSKEHKIKKREKAKGSFAKQQVKDVIFAAGAALAISAYMGIVGAPQALGGITLAVMAFAGKKVINAACRFGKKHIIKERKMGETVKKGLILTASGILPILVTGIPITGIVSAAIAAAVIAKKSKKSNSMDTDVPVSKLRRKKKGKEK